MENNEEIRQLLYQVSSAVSKTNFSSEKFFSLVNEAIKFNLRAKECFVIKNDKNFFSIINWVKKRHEMIVVDDLNVWTYSFKRPFPKGSMIVIPLVSEAIFKGAFIIYWDTSRIIKQAEVEALKLVASQISSIISINNLHKKVIKQRDELKNYLRETSDQFQTIKIQEERWRTVLDAVEDGIIISNNKGLIINSNPAFLNLLGDNKNKLNGQFICKARKYFKPYSGTSLGSQCPTVESLRKKKKVEYKELWLQKRDGDFIWVKVSSYPIFDAKSKELLMVVEVVRDINEQKGSDREKEDFITSVTHELRTPLTAVKGYLSMVLSSPKSLKSNHKDYLNKAYKASENIVELVEDLLKIIRIEDKKGSLDIKPVDCIKAMHEVIEGLEYKIKKSNIKVKRYYKNKMLYVSADYDILKIIFSNLIDNAIKYSEKGLVKINMNLLKDKELVEIVVQDTGIGISDKDISNVFDKFYRSNNILLNRVPGTGLGLYVSKKLIERMGGEISIKSKKGSGTTFTIRLTYVSQLPLISINKQVEEK